MKKTLYYSLLLLVVLVVGVLSVSPVKASASSALILRPISDGTYQQWNVFNSSLVVPSGIVAYVPITFSNSQSNVVSSGTQVSLVVNWNTYSSYLDNPVDNYVFFDISGNLLYSWNENATSNTAKALMWVVVDGSIPATSGTYTCYLGFYALGSNHLNSSGYTGEFPTATGTYGQYDNGALVFGNYWNFAGSGTTPSGWSTTGTWGGNYNNGLKIVSSNSAFSGIYISKTLGLNTVLESYTNVTSVSSNDFAEELSTSSATGNDGYTLNLGYLYGFANWASKVQNLERTSSSIVRMANSNSFLVTANTYYVLSFACSSSSQIALVNYANSVSSADSSYSSFSYICVGLWYVANSPVYIQWLRTRIEPPSNAMPSASFSPIHTPLSHWSATSDQSDSTGVQVTGSTSLYESETIGTTAQTGTITNVEVSVRAECSATSQGFKILTYVGTNSFLSSAQTPTTSFAQYSVDYAQDPNNSTEWTWAEVNALQGGVEPTTLATGDTLYVSEIWVTVSYYQTYSASISQTITFSESTTPTLFASRTISQLITFTSSTTKTLSASRAISQLITLTTSASFTQALSRSITQLITFNGVTTFLQTLQRTITQGITFSLSTSPLQSLFRSIMETIHFSYVTFHIGGISITVPDFATGLLLGAGLSLIFMTMGFMALKKQERSENEMGEEGEVE